MLPVHIPILSVIYPFHGWQLLALPTVNGVLHHPSAVSPVYDILRLAGKLVPLA